jgi:hypothetical protein
MSLARPAKDPTAWRVNLDIAARPNTVECATDLGRRVKAYGGGRHTYEEISLTSPWTGLAQFERAPL